MAIQAPIWDFEVYGSNRYRDGSHAMKLPSDWRNSHPLTSYFSVPVSRVHCMGLSEHVVYSTGIYLFLWGKV